MVTLITVRWNGQNLQEQDIHLLDGIQQKQAERRCMEQTENAKTKVHTGKIMHIRTGGILKYMHNGKRFHTKETFILMGETAVRQA